jgi:hypothetical protein
MNRTSRAMDFILYVLISSAVIGVIFLAIWLKVDWKTFMNRGSFVVLTSILFGYFISGSRSLWDKRIFWSLTIFLLAVHSFAFWEIVRRVGFFKPGWFPVIVVELMFLIGCRNLIARSTET